MKDIAKRTLVIISIVIFVIQNGYCDVTLSRHDLKLKLNTHGNFDLLIENVTHNQVLTLVVQHADIVSVTPSSVQISPDTNRVAIQVDALGAGHSEIVGNSTDPAENVKDVYLRVTVYKHHEFDIVSTIIGWIYFVAWSVSFYPQIYTNFKRQSVVGLNFDFIVLNVVGFVLYSIFNLSLYYIPEMKEEYSNRHPRGLNPVQMNDIVFALHAALATIITIVQCYIYERNDQKVSLIARSIIVVFGVFLVCSIILAGTDVIHWLDFLYFCSYVKLTITLIKYLPQAYMNYQRQSTVGWSIGNIFLDFTGGTLSMLQMIINAYNYDDWVSIFGDPTKFGLGLFSVIFDIFFIIQHYVLYRHTNYEEN